MTVDPFTTSAPQIVASILSANFAHLGAEIEDVLVADGADFLHLDVMDGHFVPNISFGAPILRALRAHTRLPFDVHLMIAPVDAYLAAFAEAGADHITVHVEAGPHLHRTLQSVRALGKQAGVAINPATPIDAIAWVLDLIGQINVMTVNPGFGGQEFLASQLPARHKRGSRSACGTPRTAAKASRGCANTYAACSALA